MRSDEEEIRQATVNTISVPLFVVSSAGSLDLCRCSLMKKEKVQLWVCYGGWWAAAWCSRVLGCVLHEEGRRRSSRSCVYG
ncbi:hypothetical protein A4A49_17929 [Nicotiana attenuata]|uniref:Uncharacterized protein n=1 Tax=Nicotiana attenuata TaxID=49451 RepID=A0A314LAF4_NICAT|nr:hypothetical protein A4A49_17929 [Nicotiana attenuata]